MLGSIPMPVPEGGDEQVEGADPIVENNGQPEMGEDSIPPRAINGMFLYMEENPVPGRVSLRSKARQRAGQSAMQLVEDRPVVYNTKLELLDQEEKNTMEQKPTRSDSYIRLRIRVEDGQMSVVGLREVEGPLNQPKRIHGEFVYEVTVGKERIGLDSFPDPTTLRGYPNPGVRGQEVHAYRPSSNYEFNVRVPRHGLSFSDLPKMQVALYRVSGNVLSQPISPKPLTDQFSHELEEVARLEKLPTSVQTNLSRVLR